MNNFLNGIPDQHLSVGDVSRALIPLGSNKTLCVQLEITSISPYLSGGSSKIKSYRSGDYSGDSFDKMYHINGSGFNNELIAGIMNVNHRARPVIKFKATATLDGQPYKLPGLVIADAESLASGFEHIYAKAKGK